MARRIRERHAHILEHEFFLEAAKAGKQHCSAAAAASFAAASILRARSVRNICCERLSFGCLRRTIRPSRSIRASVLAMVACSMSSRSRSCLCVSPSSDHNPGGPGIAREQAEFLTALLQGARETPRQQAGQVSRRFHTIEGHAYAYAGRSTKTSYNACNEAELRRLHGDLRLRGDTFSTGGQRQQKNRHGAEAAPWRLFESGTKARRGG